jgi:hypothetical protein
MVVELLELRQRETNQPFQGQQRNILDAGRGSACDGSLPAPKQEVSTESKLTMQHHLHLAEIT